MRTAPNSMFLAVLFTVLLVAHSAGTAPQIADLKPEIFRFDPFTWPSGIPQDCPFERSGAFHAIRFLGVKSGFRYGDTWYPSWAENDILYSPWTDGKAKRLDGDWKVITNRKEFGTQACFVNIPSKFIGDDGVTMRSVNKAISCQLSWLPIPAWKGKTVEFRVMRFGDGADGARAELRPVTPKTVFVPVPLRVGPP